MTTGPQYTGGQHTGPQGPGGGGRSGAIIIGVVAFSVVFLLIVAGTVGFLVLRPSGEGTDGTASATTPPTSASTTEEPTAEVSEERCWYGDEKRTSTNPAGRLRGGGLEFEAPSGFDGRSSSSWAHFLSDPQTATAPVEQQWSSALTVGAVQWQTGIEYPGDETASERIFTCMASNGAAWDGHTKGRSIQDQTTEAVTVDGMDGFRTEGEIHFAEDDLELTDASRLVVIVVDTPEGPSVFLGDVAIGVTEHEEGLEAAIESLTGLSS